MAVSGRSNGLQARAYTPLVRLDPRVADAMLETLRAGGIAAYAAPVGSEASGEFGKHLPHRPLDRLYVDVEATEPAWQVLRSHLPGTDLERERSDIEDDGPPDSPSDGPGSDDRSARGRGEDRGHRDEDSLWQDLVAAYHSEPSDPVPPWPASEDLDTDEDGPTGSRGAAGGGQVKPREGAGGPDHRTPVSRPERLGGTEPDDPGEGVGEGHFVPPHPPPVPRPDPVNGAAWLGLFGAPAYLLVSTVTGWPIPGWAAFLAVAAFIGGFVALVVRMGDGPPQDSGPDDGAVV